MKQTTRTIYAFMVIAISMLILSGVSCSKETPIHLKDFFDQKTGAWQMTSNGDVAAQRGIIEMTAPDQKNCYGIIFDESNYFNPLHDITITHDGGQTWHTQTIPGLENNYLFGEAASTGKIIHVFGYNYVAGGGNVFRSTDGGQTWQREAANAYTDPASFPDEIKFFDPQNGVLFGDPENGYFEIYTTSNGGNSWTRVPSHQIPAPKAIEQGITYFADAYLNTIWMVTVTRESATGGINGARLIQSDDQGHHWYVRNPSIPFNSSSDNVIKFRNRLVGLYKQNATLYRTTDGGTTWNVVNYAGTWFSHGLDNVPGTNGWWVSTGATDSFYPTNSVKGIGSSISYDDGDHWITIDTAVNHTYVQMTSPAHGYSGGITTAKGGDGVFVYSHK